MRPSRDLFRARRSAGTPDRDVSVAVVGSVRVSDPLYARDLAYEGVGIAYLFEPRVRDNLRAGRQGVGLKSLRICSFLARRNSLKTSAR